MNKKKETYYNFCKEEEKNIDLFFQPYWLDAICGKDGWDVIIDQTEEEVRAVMPFAILTKFGMKLIVNPTLTPYTGIYYRYPKNIIKQERKISFENKVAKEIISKIPKYLYFHLCFHPDFKNWLAFYWSGYKQSTKYTYVIPKGTNIDVAYDAIKSKTKNVIRKASAQLKVERTDDIEAFYALNDQTFKRQGKDIPYGIALIKKLDKELKQRKQRTIYLASDDSNNQHAALYIVHDHNKSYCLAIGSDKNHRSSGAISFLLWNAIKEALSAGRAFDFEGSMMPNIEPIFRSFGADQIPYYRIYKSRNRLSHALFALLGKW